MAFQERRRVYMRAWKKQQYEEQGEKIKASNRCYYFKYKFGLSSEEMRLFGDLTPECSKAINLLNQIEAENPALLRNIIKRFQ